MSNDVNSELLDRVREEAEYWTGTLWEKQIQRAVATNDLDGLRKLLHDSDIERFNQEFRPNEDS